MLLLVLKRMISNKWMVICLLIGSILAVSLISSIPLYTNGILQRMLIRDMENFQLDNHTFPGTYRVAADGIYSAKPENRVGTYRYFNEEVTGKMANAFELPFLAVKKDLSLAYCFLYFNGIVDEKAEKKSVAVTALSDMKDHITITNGKLFSGEKTSDGVYEAVITEKAMQQLKLVMNKVYPVEMWGDKENNIIKIKVTGVFTLKDNTDPYWNYGIDEYNSHFLIDYDLFVKDFIDNDNGRLTGSRWYYALDYHKMEVEHLDDIISAYESQSKWAARFTSTLTIKMPVIDILKRYSERAVQLKTTLWVIMVPVLIMLTFYIFMVTQLLVKNDENGIAVLESRGASRLQITFSYFVESLVIGGVALAAGPPLGLLICRILGACNGFLEFVQRTALPLKMSVTAYLYSIAAVGFLIITMLIPVIASSGTTIVNYKQKKAGTAGKSIWRRFCLDIVALIIAGYGYKQYTDRMKLLKTTGAKASEMTIDPLLFVVSTLFVLGLGLLFLRIYPYFLKLVYWLGRKLWPPQMYVSLLQVARSKGQEQFLMLFIILSISIGLFNANSARTINKNVEDKVHYSIGADVTLLAKWEDNQPDSTDMPGMGGMSLAGSYSNVPLKYFEPDYRKYSTIEGTEMATKVLKAEKASIEATGKKAGGITVMGIIPDQFAQIAWFRYDLLPYHWIDYTNIMTDAPKAMILSSNLRETLDVKEGDTIYVTWGNQGYLEGMVYAFVDYWPTLVATPKREGQPGTGFVIMNLSYIQDKFAIQPYEVWIKKVPGTEDKVLNDDIINKKLEITNISYTNQELIKKKNDPLLQGTNGALTLGFVAAMLISLLGFLIYWIISIQSRELQFGIFRAMGMSLKGVIGIISFEQLLVSGGAIIAGIGVGGLAGDIFIPFFQMLYSAAEQVPPFKIVAIRDDYLKIYSILAIMLVSGFTILWRTISAIKIDQALKLGED